MNKETESYINNFVKYRHDIMTNSERRNGLVIIHRNWFQRVVYFAQCVYERSKRIYP